MTRRRAWLLVGAIVLLPFAIMAGMLGYARRVDGRIVATRDRGTRVVEAIARFEWREGRLPDSLAQLTPDLLPTVPAPLWGGAAWDYRLMDASTACATGAPEGEGRYFELAACHGTACAQRLFYNSCRAVWATSGGAPAAPAN